MMLSCPRAVSDTDTWQLSLYTHRCKLVHICTKLLETPNTVYHFCLLHNKKTTRFSSSYFVANHIIQNLHSFGFLLTYVSQSNMIPVAKSKFNPISNNPFNAFTFSLICVLLIGQCVGNALDYCKIQNYIPWKY